MRMKFIISLLILLMGVSSCDDDDMKPAEGKYKKGDIVLLKPDSIKCVILYSGITPEKNFKYVVTYYDHLGVQHTTTAMDFEIFEGNNSKEKVTW